MNLIIIICLFYVPYIALRFGFKKKITYPATLFSLVFAIVLTIADVSHDLFSYYPISLGSYAVYGLGNISFIIGSLVVTQFTAPRKTDIHGDIPVRVLYVRIFFYVLLAICAIYSPIIYNEFIAATPNMPLSLRILRIRERGLTEQVFSTLTYNMIILSTLVVMLGAYLFSIRKIKIYTFVIAYAIFAYYNFLTGTRAAIILITLAALFIYSLNSKKVSRLLLILIFTSAFVLGAVVAIFMGKDGMDRDAGLVQNMSKVVDNYFSYTVQGVILFDNYVTSHHDISANWDILSGSKEIGNKIFGDGTFANSSKFSDFSRFAPDKDGNVYTIYFSVYPLYGIVGILLFFLFYGAVCSLLYSKAIGVYSVLLCYVNATLCLNIFNEQVFTNMIFTIKLIVFLIICRFFERLK